jgi:hypothetical protein
VNPIAIERATEKHRKFQRFQRLKAIQVAMEAVLDGTLASRNAAAGARVGSLRGVEL